MSTLGVVFALLIVGHRRVRALEGWSGQPGHPSGDSVHTLAETPALRGEDAVALFDAPGHDMSDVPVAGCQMNERFFALVFVSMVALTSYWFQRQLPPDMRHLLVAGMCLTVGWNFAFNPKFTDHLNWRYGSRGGSQARRFFVWALFGIGTIELLQSIGRGI
jgi:hypothetical protein